MSSGTHRKIFSMTKSQFCLGLTCLSMGVVGCEGEQELLEISSSQAALTAAENSERALQGVIDAADFLASTSIAETLNAFSAGSETCESSGVACLDGAACPEPETECTTDEVSAEELEQARQDIRERAVELVRELRERVLIDANLESSTSTSATYKLGADVLCSESDEPDASLAGAPDLDEDCVDQVTRLTPRLVLTSPREGDIDVTFQLGAERHEPLALALYHDSVGLRLDLGEALAVARELGEDEELQSIQELSGRLELRLVENAARDYSLELNVLEKLEAVLDSDGDHLSASLGASSPAWNVRVDGNSGTLSAGMDVAAFRLVGPLRAFASLFETDDDGSAYGDTASGLLPEEEPEPRSYTGILDVFLAGLTGTVSYAADSDVLAIDQLGFGDGTSTLKHDGDTLLSLDLNPASGRRVNLLVSSTDAGTQIRITPSFDLRLALAFHYIADQFDGLATYLLDDTLRVWFDGDAPELELGEALRVTAGTLHIESVANPEANVTVEAGMCLSGENGSDADDDATHPLFSLEATTCE
jgi:hypothetical protein